MEKIKVGDAIPKHCIYFDNKHDKCYGEEEKLPPITDRSTYATKDYIYTFNESEKGWHVKVKTLKKSKKNFEQIIHDIGGYPVKFLNGAFAGCKKMEISPDLPPCTTDISGTYELCDSLKIAPKIPSKVKEGFQAFRRCSALTEAPLLPRFLLSAQGMFEDCELLEYSPPLPNKIMDIRNMFSGCIALKAVPKLPKHTDSMSWAFYNCKSILQVPEIPPETWCMTGAFYGCSSLKIAPKIPKNVESFDMAFAYCQELRGEVQIDSSPKYAQKYEKLLEGVHNPIVLMGSSERLQEIAAESGAVDVRICK